MPGGIFRSGEEAAVVTALAGTLTLAAAAVVTSERLDRGQAAVSFREKIL